MLTRYISWIEQEYPKGGKEGNLSTLIESCIKKFKDEKSVRNDVRFLEIWLKYAAMASKPLEVFEFMYSEGMCTHLSDLFITWAWYLESAQSYKKAETVFTKGIDAMVDRETRERLRIRQEQFRSRVKRRLNGEEIPDEEVEDEQRSALGQLRGHGRKGKVSNIRVGAEKLGGPGVLGGGVAVVRPLKNSNTQQQKFTIYSDEASGSSSSSRSGGPSSHVPSRADHKENVMAAGTWSKARVVKKSQNVPLDSISQYSKPAFTVYEEPDIAQPSQTPQRKMMAAETNVLATNKGGKKPDCPIALFEPPDPSKRAMYCKDRVYQGTTEFSFEELRALRFMERQKQLDEKMELDKRRAELLEMENRLKEQQEAMNRQMKEQQEAMKRQMEEFQRLRFEPSQEKERLPGAVTRPGLSCEEEEGSCPSLSRAASLDSTAVLLNANPTGSLATPSPLACRGGLARPSPTINTREAMDVMQQLWSKPIGEEDQPPVPLVYTEPAQPAPVQPFTIFCDEAENVPPRRQNSLTRRDRVEMINGNDKENFLMPSIGENRENLPPPDYIKPNIEVRTKTGILTEADNVEFMPLEEQEKLLDQEEERGKFQVFVETEPEPPKQTTMPKPFGGNQTLLLPNEEDFGEMARLSSTPFTGKPSHHFEQDENTCAVDILYKMPPPPAPAEEPQQENRLDTIVETSREYYKSSSSSSCGETLHHHTNRSHWGNTGHTIISQTAGLSVVTPGHHLGTVQGSLTNASGYLGDKSNNITKSGVKDNKRELISSPQVVPFDKKMKKASLVEEEEDGFDEPTGLFSDMMAELKQGKAQFQTDLETSVQVSFLSVSRDKTRMDVSQAAPICLDVTPRLDMTEAVSQSQTNLTLGLHCTAGGLGAVTPPPELDLTNDMEDLASKATNLSIDHMNDKEELDPFHPETHKLWLSQLKNPVHKLHGYVDSRSTKMPIIKARATVSLGSDVFLVQECKGEGGYAKVWSAVRQDDDMDCTIAGIDAVLKVQRPANDWEFYVCTQVQQRIPDNLASAFMSIPRNYAFRDGGVFVSYHQKFGSLLDIINIVKQCPGNKFSIEPMAVFFTIELLKMVEALHGAGIIHADLKADNLLLKVSIYDASTLSFIFYF